MQAPMKQLLAERLGVNEEQLAQIQAGDPSSLLASGRISDPMTAILMACMARRDQEKSEPAVEDELARARRTNRRLKEALESAAVMIRHVAGLFGACAACWGQNGLCRHCGGDGKPGSGTPNGAELLAWVEPALEKLGLKVVPRENKN